MFHVLRQQQQPKDHLELFNIIEVVSLSYRLNNDGLNEETVRTKGSVLINGKSEIK